MQDGIARNSATVETQSHLALGHDGERDGPMEDGPAKIEALIRKAINLPTNPNTSNTEGFKRLRAEVWMEESEGLLRSIDATLSLRPTGAEGMTHREEASL